MKYLHDILPARVRWHVYGTITLALAVWSIWEASQGDWGQFAIAIASATATAMAQGNTDTSGPAE
ncbi:hypothetical protein [Demequina globuliformis]|uniref:hypothetical protein n=1 Tax=Demequina globuliformis TaxID=676202 RepID=UPI000782230A|nr:hypothetical protein [Demequina globuliformis]